jgi:hypothetical protein
MALPYQENGYSKRGAKSPIEELPTIESLVVSENGVLKNVKILSLLRHLAKRNRNGISRSFYSIRAVAKHFTLPATTVTRMYRQLKEEGLLTSAWGSRTFVEPNRVNRDLRVRGTIALPVALSSFSHLRNHRMFFLSMRNALWKFGFATRLLFYEGAAERDNGFAEDLLSSKVDGVIWFLPGSNDRMIAARVADRGIRVISLTDSLASSNGHRYALSREAALHECLAGWKKEGVTSAIIVHSERGEALGRVAAISVCLHVLGIKQIPMGIECLKTRVLAQTSHRENCGIIFTSSELALRLINEDRVRFTKLLEKHRILLLDGMIDSPAGVSLQGPLDTIEFDWPRATRRIANDLVRPMHSHLSKPVIVEGRWVCRRDHIARSTARISID